MKYFKLIDQQNIIGAVSSNNFIVYSPSADCYLAASERTGEYANYQNKLYRDTWMVPFQLYAPHTLVTMIEISEEEYKIIYEALKVEDTIQIKNNDTEEIPMPEQSDPIEEMTIEYVRNSKLQEMSYACRTTIEAGFDLELRGETHHFSLDTQDQLNLISLSAMAQTQSLIPYHADGEACIFFSSEEINEIVETATAFKIYHTTYYNALKGYINALQTIEEISAIQYGTPIPEEYKSDVLRALEG